jgi:hypothetical protein
MYYQSKFIKIISLKFSFILHKCQKVYSIEYTVINDERTEINEKSKS